LATCIKCEEDYSDKRRALGYRTCLNCGEASAQRIVRKRTAASLRAMTPNHFAGSIEEHLDEREG